MKQSISIKYNSAFSMLLPFTYNGDLNGLNRKFHLLLIKVDVSNFIIQLKILNIDQQSIFREEMQLRICFFLFYRYPLFCYNVWPCNDEATGRSMPCKVRFKIIHFYFVIYRSALRFSGPQVSIAIVFLFFQRKLLFMIR